MMAENAAWDKTKSMSARWTDQSQAWKNGASAPCRAEGLAADLLSTPRTPTLGITGRKEPSAETKFFCREKGHRRPKSWRKNPQTADRRAGGKILRERWMNLDELDVEPKKILHRKKNNWNRSSWENLTRARWELEEKQICVRTRTLAQRPKQAGRVNCFEKSLSNTGKIAPPYETQNQPENCREQDTGGQLEARETDRDQEHPTAVEKWISFRSKNFRSDENQVGKSKSNQWIKITSQLKLKLIHI
jgi:hypothetical protein